MRRRVSSSSSRSVSCDVRLSTACSRSSMPCSRAASTRSHTSVGLRRLVAAEDQVGPRAVRALGAQLLRERAARLRRERVGRVEDRLRGAVVALQRDHRRVGEVVGELQDVLGRSGAPAVDRLEVVADRGHVAPLARAARARCRPAARSRPGTRRSARGRTPVSIVRPDHLVARPVRASTGAGRRGRARPSARLRAV